jgi:hypothetical protein
MPSFLYLALRRIFELLVLLGRSADRKELEIVVLRHELSVLRRQGGRLRYEHRDRVLLAALSGALPRVRWSGFRGDAADAAALASPHGQAPLDLRQPRPRPAFAG